MVSMYFFQTVDVQDDMEALSIMATDYKGRKRKNDGTSVRKSQKKVKVLSNENDDIMHCFICENDIPRSQFEEHVDEELKKQAKEDEEKGI